MDRKKKVLLVTRDLPASDRRVWSGIPFSLKKQLEKEFIVEEYYVKKNSSFLALIKTLYYRVIKKQFISLRMLKSFAIVESKKVDRIVRKNKYDCILTAAVSNAGIIAYSKSCVPKVFFSDCVVSGLFNYYWFNIDNHIINEMNEVQQNALFNSSAIVLTSNWAKNNAIKDYNVNPQKINVFHMGANIEVNECKHTDHEGIQLLFVGVDWVRKGAEIAIECVKYLNRLDKEKKYTLHLVGCEPPRKIESEYVKIYGFLNRNNKEEREKLDFLRTIADFFILPTRAECAGIVFCEASAYGIPSITYDTGGIGDYIKNDINGYRLPMDATGKDFAMKILEYSQNQEIIDKLKKNSRYLYETELNWDITGKKLCKLINNLIEDV